MVCKRIRISGCSVAIVWHSAPHEVRIKRGFSILMLITEFWLCWADIYSCCCWCHFHCCRTTAYSDWCAPSGISIFCVLHHTIGPLYCCVFWQEIKLVKILHIKKGILSRQGSVWLATYWVLLTMPTEQSQWPPAGSLRSENNMAFIHTQRQQQSQAMRSFVSECHQFSLR